MSPSRSDVLRHTLAHDLHRHRPAPARARTGLARRPRPGGHLRLRRRQAARPRRRCAELGEELADLQERMYADAYTGGSRRVLVVLQGMDTSGKGGVIEHALGLLNPNGLRLTSFKKPTEEELAHDFLWRIEKALPDAGMVGVFDRSHYEDVLVARVHELADDERDRAPLRRDQRLREGARRLRHRGPQVHAARLAPRSSGSGCSRGSTTPTKQWKFKPERRRRAGALGRLPGGVRGRARALQHRRGARGTSYRATTSGTATGRSASSCSRRCAGWSWSGPSPTTTSASSGRGSTSRSDSRSSVEAGARDPLRHAAA